MEHVSHLAPFEKQPDGLNSNLLIAEAGQNYLRESNERAGVFKRVGPDWRHHDRIQCWWMTLVHDARSGNMTHPIPPSLVWRVSTNRLPNPLVLIYHCG